MESLLQSEITDHCIPGGPGSIRKHHHIISVVNFAVFD